MSYLCSQYGVGGGEGDKLVQERTAFYITIFIIVFFFWGGGSRGWLIGAGY